MMSALASNVITCDREENLVHRLFKNHPGIMYLFTMVAVPAAMLLAVTAAVCGIVIPVSFLAGWM